MKKFLAAFVLLLFAFSKNSFSQRTLIFEGGNVVLGEYISILEDPGNFLEFKNVKTSRFEPSEAPIPNLKLSKSDFWLKFSVTNKSKERDLSLMLDYPTLDVCEFYYPNGEKYEVARLTDTVPFNRRKYKHQNFIFDLRLEKDSTETFFLKVRSSEQMVLPLILGTPQTITQSVMQKDMLWGILIGLLAVMILYNFFIFVSTKDISYLYYVLYTASIGLTQTSLSGYTYRYLFPNSPGTFDFGLIMFPALAGLSAMFFVKSFLNTSVRTPLLNKFFPAAITLYTAAVVLRALGFDQLSYRMIDISALVTTGLIYAVAVVVSWQGYRPARYFLLAWTMFFTGLTLFILRNLGILPYNIYTNYTMQAGIAIEVTLLSLALADKINILKKEKEESQAEALRIARINESIIRDQNAMLELKVSERTSELQQANVELSKALVDLKETQTQLVESEKMASLGQLTAGIAHEINNPINFVTSNIGPLKRDVGILLEAVETIEEVGLSDGAKSEKQSKIEEYKEEIDFDFLKIEIEHLLKGINEGASRTAEIVKGLRIFSRVDEDDLKRADINEGLNSTLVLVNNILNNKIKVEKSLADLPLIECYPGKLNQVFLNIISNAIHAIHKQHPDEGGVLRISTGYSDNQVSVKIADNGTGMDEITKKKIFEPFFTTKEVGEGTGLGLSISYNTIKKHNGTITVHSEIGKGTEFVLDLPILHNESR